MRDDNILICNTNSGGATAQITDSAFEYDVVDIKASYLGIRDAETVKIIFFCAKERM